MAFPPWAPLAAFGVAIVSATLYSFLAPDAAPLHVAFIGNSIMYYGDMPRMITAISGGRVRQNSVLSPGAGIFSVVVKQNGMWNRWRTDSALVDGYNDVWDFGACTIEMMLFGHNATEAEEFYDVAQAEMSYEDLDDDLGYEIDGRYYVNDPRLVNPCCQSHAYLEYLAGLDADDIRITPKHWDYVVLSDKTAGFGIDGYLEDVVYRLNNTFVPLLRETGAVPVLVVTHGYWKQRDSEVGYRRVPKTTALAYDACRQYASYLASQLPHSQRPRLVNMGIAYLTLWEENLEMWLKLFVSDNKHPTPHGAFLIGCVLHHTLFDNMPYKRDVLLDDMSTLYDNVRTLMYPKDEVFPYPTKEEAECLYDVARRVAEGHVPESLKEYREELGLSTYMES